MKEGRIEKRKKNGVKIQNLKMVFDLLEKLEGKDDGHLKYINEMDSLMEENEILDNNIIGLEKACLQLNENLKRVREEGEPGCSNTLLGAGGKKRKATPSNPINVTHHTPR